MGGDEELTGAGVGEFVPLELSSDVVRVLVSQIGRISGGGKGGAMMMVVAVVARGIVGALNNDPLGLDVKLGEFLLVIGGIVAVVVIVAGIDADFDLRVETSIDFRGGIEAAAMLLLLLLLLAAAANAAGRRTGGMWRWGANLGSGRGC